MKSYSQYKALWAITKASLKSIFKSPQAVFFSLFFPVILIVIFGSLGGSNSISLDVAFTKNADTINPLYQAVQSSPVLHVVRSDPADIKDKMKKGKISALLDIQRTNITDTITLAPYKVIVQYSSANQRELPALLSILQNIVGGIHQLKKPVSSIATITTEELPGRPYKRIDFLLPGMIGFSLIGASVFGVAFLFFGLRETLVLKRMYASPVKKAYIVIGESIARIIYQLSTAVVLILIGKYFYDFTLSHGVVTFFEILAVCVIALIVFMGFGFIISSVAKNQNVIPIYANIFMFPQYFLSGTFFSKEALPKSIQWLVETLPLTVVNDTLRKISFEGAHLYGCWKELGGLCIWGIVVYAIAIRVFKWE